MGIRKNGVLHTDLVRSKTFFPWIVLRAGKPPVDESVCEITYK
jgi:hypothetical protein